MKVQDAFASVCYNMANLRQETKLHCGCAEWQHIGDCPEAAQVISMTTVGVRAKCPFNDVFVMKRNTATVWVAAVSSYPPSDSLPTPVTNYTAAEIY
jgi:hypothetical protein